MAKLTKKEMNQVVAKATEMVEAMTVAEMRKQASKYGIKNAKQYKRVELAQKLIDASVEVMVSTIVETKKSEKKSSAAKVEKKDKRYKASKIGQDDIESEVNAILSATPAELDAMDLYSVNRKVLIEAMKQLHCKLWYRTYDKPTMIAKISDSLGSKEAC